MQPNDRISRRESDQRLKSILHGAFDGPPTPLKEIPKRNGEPRSQAKHAAHPSELERGVKKPKGKRQAE